MFSAKKFFALCACAIALTTMSLSARHDDRCTKDINRCDVAGTYQISGFSNSLDGDGTFGQPQSQAFVGQARFKKDGTGVVTFINFPTIINGDLFTINQQNIQFTYNLGPVNGQGSFVLQNFPAAGVNPTFAISFKRNCEGVVGFSFVTIANTVTTARWTLGQAERFQ